MLIRRVVLAMESFLKLSKTNIYQKNKLKYFHLPNRFGGAKQPKGHLVDMLKEQDETGKFGQVISGFLQNKIEERLNRKEQVILELI